MTIESEQWYYNLEGAQYGPLEVAEVRLLIQCGEIPPGVLACIKGGHDWLPAREHACFHVEVFPSMKKTGLQINRKFQDTWKIYRVCKANAVIGRPSERPVDVDLSPDRAISRQHAKVWAINNKIWVRDMHSKWGTFVNGEKIEASCLVTEQDMVTIGETQISFQRFPLSTEPDPKPDTADLKRSFPGLKMQATQQIPPHYLKPR